MTRFVAYGTGEVERPPSEYPGAKILVCRVEDSTQKWWQGEEEMRIGGKNFINHLINAFNIDMRSRKVKKLKVKIIVTE